MKRIFNIEISSKRISDYFVKEIRVLYAFSMSLFIASFIIDLIINYGKYSYSPVAVNVPFILFLAVLFYLGMKNIVPYQLTYAITVYAFAAIMIISYIYFFDEIGDYFFTIFQDIMYVHLIIISAGLIIGKRHILILGSIFFVFYPALMCVSKIQVLRDAVPLVGLLIGGPVIILFYVLNSFEKSLEQREKLEIETKKQKNELKKLNEEKDKLFSLLAHDLRGPLGNVKNMISLTLDSYLSETEKEEILRASITNLDKIFNLFTSLLDWTTNQLGAFKYSPQNIDLYLLVQDTIEFLQVPRENKDITIVNAVTPRLMTYSDKTLLASIFRNLLSNAIKFSDRGGIIKIETDYYDNNILVKVKDNGRGIPEEKLENIFDESLGKTTFGTENEKGYGFGLSLVKDFVEKNGGKIWVKSEPNKGTTFYFTLPLSAV